MNREYVIVDIDGTVSNVGKRTKYAEKGQWEKYHKLCYKDTPNFNVIKIVKALQKSYIILFCTGRATYNGVVSKTIKWIKKYIGINCVLDRNLLMRKEGDYRPDEEVKCGNIHLLGIRQENIVCVLEDKNSMVAHWRKLGFTCLQVSAGYDRKIKE